MTDEEVKTDIVERLRPSVIITHGEAMGARELHICQVGPLMSDAAAEIERLRLELVDAQMRAQAWKQAATGGPRTALGETEA